MEQKYIKSPLNYTGGKYRLLKKIIPLFPNKIDTFVDLFGGAMNVCVNVEANNIFGNDYIHYLPTLFNTWKNKSLEDINQYIDNKIKQFELSGENYDSFIEFRKHYNNTKNIEDLFILVCHSFNFQMRFNNSHEYNSSFGKTASIMNPKIRQNLNAFVKTIKEKDIIFTNKDFREFNFRYLGEDDLVYCDPPYYISCGVYQDGKRGFGGWTKQDDNDLMKLLDELNSVGVKFAMSNVFENKGLRHDDLINWSKKYNIHHLDMNYNSANYQRESSKSDEVLITNY